MKLNQKILLLLSYCLGISAVYADELATTLEKINRQRDDQRIQNNQFEKEFQTSLPAQRLLQTNDQKVINLSKKELLQRPDLVIRAILPAVAQNNSENVAFLLPLYQQLDKKYYDPLFAKWALAIIEKSQQRYTNAVRLYREVLAKNANIPLARFQLAIALFENKELEAAEGQFQKLRSELQLPPDLQAMTVQYLLAIQHQDRWSFNGGITYLNDPNINNAPKSGTHFGKWHAPKAESGQGLGLGFNVGKKWSWGNGFFNEFRFDTNGKYYWNNKKYNEWTIRSDVGIGYQNAKVEVVLLPFIEQRFYAGGTNDSNTIHRFSKAGGATLETSYWLSPQWQARGFLEYGEQRYQTRKHLNGHYYLTSISIAYSPNAKQYWFGGLDFNRTHTRDKDDSFVRKGVRVGWGQEWGLGLSTRFSLSYAYKHYKAPNPLLIFGNQAQRNKEFGITTSLWHRALHYKGITPRLTWIYTKVNSNQLFYRYDKQRLFIEFRKQF